MASFTGDYICKVDGKNRITIPSSFKKQMAASEQERFIVKKDMFDNCLVLYTLDVWEQKSREFRARLNPYKREHKIILRGFYKDTMELEIDSNNRILIPRRILDQANIENEVVLAGQDDQIEIWAKDLYDNIESGETLATLIEKNLGGNNQPG